MWLSGTSLSTYISELLIFYGSHSIIPAVLGNKLNAPHHLHHHQHTADLFVCLKGVKHLHLLKSFSFFQAFH